MNDAVEHNAKHLELHMRLRATGGAVAIQRKETRGLELGIAIAHPEKNFDLFK